MTIRDQLQKHRTSFSCADCHRKIDPLGFPLENFDAIGKWRDSYSGQAKIDSAGELPSGHKFDDIHGLKVVLVEQQKQFITALTTKLVAYATGRQIHPTERLHIVHLVNQLNDRGNGLRDLVELVATSDIFRKP